VLNESVAPAPADATGEVAAAPSATPAIPSASAAETTHRLPLSPVTQSSVTRPRPVGGGIFRDMIPGGDLNGVDENTHPNKRRRNEVLAIFL
jgi:hypothetical protein